MEKGRVLLIPECDLTESGDTFHPLWDIDNIPPRLLLVEIALYANGADLGHPYVSKLSGDFARGFPPIFIRSGTRDLYLSNSVRMHRALQSESIAADLHVWEAAPHGGFLMEPEVLELKTISIATAT